MNDDELIRRMQHALDEVHAADNSSAPAVPSRRGLASGRWIAIAATVVLVAGTAVGLVVRHNGSPEAASKQHKS